LEATPSEECFGGGIFEDVFSLSSLSERSSSEEECSLSEEDEGGSEAAGEHCAVDGEELKEEKRIKG
jgi:hypothetical protein